jgi:hypothetical protein
MTQANINYTRYMDSVRDKINKSKTKMILTEAKLRNMEKNALISHSISLQNNLLDNYEENTFLQSKIARIVLEISERFDADGIDDITLPKKVNLMFIVMNAKAVVKLFKAIIDIIKEKKAQPISILTEEKVLNN